MPTLMQLSYSKQWWQSVRPGTRKRMEEREVVIPKLPYLSPKHFSR